MSSVRWLRLFALLALVFTGLVLVAPSQVAHAQGPAQQQQSANAEALPASDQAADDKEEDIPVDQAIPADEIKAGDEAAAHHDSAKYAAFIRAGVAKVRELVLPKLEAKIEAKHAEKMDHLSLILGAVSMGGLLLLFMPLFLAKKYPGKFGVLFKFSAIAAVSAFVVMNLFAGVVLLTKSVQGAAAGATNPQVMIIEASLDTLDADADDLVEFGPSIVEPSLSHLGAEGGDMPAVLLGNVMKIARDAGPFISAAKVVKSASFLFEYVPPITSIIAIVVFLVGARPVLKELIALPGRAASGADTKGIVGQAFKFVGREFVAALGLVAGVVVLSLVSAVALSLTLQPTVHDLLGCIFENVRYVQHPDASSGLIFGSLLLTTLALVLDVLIVTVSSALFLGKLHKILQARVHHRIPLAVHGKFWLWGTLGLLLAQAFPYLYGLATRPIIDAMTERAFGSEEPNFALLLLGGPVIMVAGWILVFWAVRGVKGLSFIKKYAALPPAPAAPPQVAFPQAALG